MTPQFRNTSIRLIRDVSLGLGRDFKDAQWVGRFCLAFVGNLGHESGGFALMEEGSPTVKGSLGGISLPQWTGMKAGGRRGLFMAWCRANHLHPYSYDAAIGFILHELTTTAKGVVLATYNAGPTTLADVPDANPALLGRVVRFERLYENAGVKHYASRYKFAAMALQAYREWIKAGFPEPGKFVMPRARFTAEFDREFGTGESATTARSDLTSPTLKAGENLTFNGTVARSLPDGRVEVQTGNGTAIVPAATMRRGTWPEDHLSSDQIKAIQDRFRSLGYVRIGLSDGRWTQSVRNTVLAMQAEHGLAVDGHYGPEVRKALLDGLRHKVDEVRANATVKDLTKAGEPTLKAVQPASLVAKIGAWVASASTAIVGIASFFPQASTTIDWAKNYITDVPPYVWTLATALVAAYLWYTLHQVKKVAVDNFRSGANTALATPIANDNRGWEIPDVPGAGPIAPWQAATFDLPATPLDTLDFAMGEDHQSEIPEADDQPEDDARPLGTDDQEAA